MPTQQGQEQQQEPEHKEDGDCMVRSEKSYAHRRQDREEMDDVDDAPPCFVDDEERNEEARIKKVTYDNGAKSPVGPAPKSRRTSMIGFRATLAFERIQQNQWLTLAWALFKLTPPLLSLVGLGLSIYALVDFAEFSKEYNQLQDEVKEQSQKDFDLIDSTFLKITNLVLSVGEGMEACKEKKDIEYYTEFMEVIDKMMELAASPQRVSTAFLPSGVVWNDYFVERFPSLDNLASDVDSSINTTDYASFANPTRIATISIYGIPNMEPLFRTFLASLIFDIASVVLLVGPAMFLWMGGRKETRKGGLLMFGFDLLFFMVSLALLLVTAKLASSTSGYGVGTVQGRVSFFEGITWNEHIKEGVNPEYWGQTPEHYCSEDIVSCYPNNSYQPGCSSAKIDITAPYEFLAQDGNRWFVDLNITGVTLGEKNITKFLDVMYTDDDSILAYVEQGFFSGLPFAFPQDIQDAIIAYKNSHYATACPAGEQQFFWDESGLSTVQFPRDQPDYEYVCNTQCQHNWTDPALTYRLDCPPGCKSESCGCTFINYETCAINCPDVETVESCGCLAFGYSMWKFNCTSQFTVVTEENYNRFTSFAVSNVQEGLVYDIAATAIDFVAICLVAIGLFVPRVQKLLNKDEEVSRRNIPSQISLASLGKTLLPWPCPRSRLQSASTQKFDKNGNKDDG